MLYENHYVRLYDERNPKDSNERNQNKTIDGEWSFDEALKQYAISLNGATTNHTVDLQDANFRIPSYLAADGRMPLYPTCCPAG
jgi:hypothetical protein